MAFTPNPKQTHFVAEDEVTATQMLAAFLPNGELFRAKNIVDSKLYKFINGIVEEIIRAQEKIVEIADEYDLSRTQELILEWESALGIPDECFDPISSNAALSDRREYVIAKLARMNIINRQEFIDLASLLGISIEITGGGGKYSTFPYTFPMILFGSKKEAYFTMIVWFDPAQEINTFTYTFPITFTLNKLSILECLFTKLSPANVKVIFISKALK